MATFSPTRFFLFLVSLWLLILGTSKAAVGKATSSQSKTLSSQEERSHASTFGTPKGPLTLQNCFELAVMRSETLGMKEADIRFAQALYWESIGSMMPQISGSVSETLRDERPSSFGSGGQNGGGAGGAGGGGAQSGSGQRRDQFQAHIGIKQPIFTGFREWNTAGANKAELQARTFDKARAYELLYLDVTDAFYQTYYYQADLKVMESFGEALERRVAELNRRIQLGRSRKGELLLAQSELADAKVTVESVKGLLAASKELMAFLTGLPASQIELVEKHPLPGPVALEKYLSSVGNRSDILAAFESERAARKRLSAAKGERFGTASVEFDYYPYQNPNLTGDWSLLLKYELPIFDGGVIESRIRQQKALFETSELQLEQLKRSSVRDVRTAFVQFNAAIEQNLKLEEEFEVVQENLDIQNQDYQLGRVSNLEVLDAIGRVHQTRRKLLSAQSDVRVALARLYVQAGKLPQRVKTPLP